MESWAVVRWISVISSAMVAGAASLLVKVRTGTTEELQGVLRRLFAVDGVTGTQTIVVLESFFERPVAPARAAS